MYSLSLSTLKSLITKISKPNVILRCISTREHRKIMPRKLSSTKSSSAKSKSTKTELKHVQYKKKRGIVPPAAYIRLSVIGNGTKGNPTSLLVATNETKYLFNCGESTQRLCFESKEVKLSRLEHVFVTHRRWENVGGLLGLCLTLAGSHVPRFTFHGPPGVEKIITESRGFAPIFNMDIVKHDIDDGSFNDGIMQVDYIPIYTDNSPCITSNPDDQPPDKKPRLDPCSTNDTPKDNCDNLAGLTGDNSNDNVRTKEVGETSDNCTEKKEKYINVSRTNVAYDGDIKEEVEDVSQSQVSQDNRDVTVVYVCTPTKKSRKVDMEKCVAIDLPMGPHIKELVAGVEVTLPNGRHIKPDDILMDEEPPYPFMVLECPNEHFLDNFLQSESLQHWQQEDTAVKFVAHFTPGHIVRLDRYQQFINRFPASVQHLMLDGCGSEIAGTEVYRMQAQMNMIDPHIFPLLHNQCKQASQKDESPKSNIVRADCGMVFHIRPQKSLDRENCYLIDNDAYIEEVKAQDEFKEKFQETRTLLDTSPRGEDPALRYPEILFLGTGSSIPNKSRNVSAILVHTSSDQCMLLDCGEGTVGQIVRYYGNQADDIIRKLSCVYISHMHGDHHLGLISLVTLRRHLLEVAGEPVTPLKVVAPWNLRRWINSVHFNIEPIKPYIQVLALQEMISQKPDNFKEELVYEVETLLQLKKFESAEVHHVRNSFGCSLTHKDGWKICYSGDTMPCDALIEIGRDCDVLIHEATMEDDLVVDARDKKHSTTSQAIEVGSKMGAKFILLTHFSQRYKIPVFTDHFTSQVGIAFDNMRVTRNDLCRLPHFKPALQAIFAEHVSLNEAKTQKRILKRELEQMYKQTA